MPLLKAFVDGLKPGRETLLPVLLFWLCGLLPAWLGTAPLRSGLHAALDNSAAASELSSGGGLDLLAELGMHQPGLWAAGFALFLPALILSVVLGLFVAAGTYARAASPEGSVWTRFWAQGLVFFVPAFVVLLLNGIVWGVIALVPGGILGGISLAHKGATDPSLAWTLFRVGLLCALVVVALFHGSAGFGRAWCARSGRGTNPARAFLKGLTFSVRRLPQTQAITWFYGGLRTLATVAALAWLSPGFSTEGAVAGTFLLTQVGFLAVAYLKVAEIRTQCAYLGEVPQPQASCATPLEDIRPREEGPAPEGQVCGEVAPPV